MKRPLVSILIPVYNVEGYLAKCLDSLINQTLTDIEIICVNDGSTDGSAEILEKYKEKDSRIKIVTKENGGLPSARNAGINVAQGKYLGFVDSDDFVEHNMFKRLYEVAEKDKADIVVCGANVLPEDKRASQWLYDCLSPQYTQYTEFDSDILYKRGDVTPFLWRNFVKRELIEKYNLRLDEDIIIGEDKAFQCKLFPRAERITVIPDKLYNYYWCRPDSLMQKQVYANKEKRVVEHSKLVARIASDILNSEVMMKDEAGKREFCEWSIPFIYDDFMYLSHANKCAVAKTVIDAWDAIQAHTYFSDMPDWKRAAFEYIDSYVGEAAVTPKISVVTYVGNDSKYVDAYLSNIKCLMDNDVEFIIVNSGMSTQNYLLVQKFLYTNKTVRLFNAPEHLTYADALNNGVLLAVGDYVVFMDTHDWITSKEDLIKWVEYARSNQYDICVSNESRKKAFFENDNADKKANLYEQDFHSCVYRKQFFIDKELSFPDASIYTGYGFLCKALVNTEKIGLYSETVYVMREIHQLDWLSTVKCEKVLELFDELLTLSIEQKDANLHGSVFANLNGDVLKTIVVNNTKPYYMPITSCPDGENSQIATVGALFSICNKMDVDMLYEYGFTDEDSVISTLCEVIMQRNSFYNYLSDRVIM